MNEYIRFLSTSAHPHILSNADMYLPRGGLPLKAKLAGLLLGDALSLGATDVRIVLEGEWCAVAADRDWLRLGAHLDNLPSLFHRLLPLPEAGVNSIRHEVVVAAFASDVVTSVGGDVTIVKVGNNQELLTIGVNLCRSDPLRVIAFRCSEGSIQI